jgi:hypothetical protein
LRSSIRIARQTTFVKVVTQITQAVIDRELIIPFLEQIFLGYFSNLMAKIMLSEVGSTNSFQKVIGCRILKNITFCTHCLSHKSQN